LILMLTLKNPELKKPIPNPEVFES